MKRWLNIAIQATATAGDIWLNFGGFVPPDVAHKITPIIMTAQGIVGVIAHNYNPDGTNAKAPYIPPSEKTDYTKNDH